MLFEFDAPRPFLQHPPEVASNTLPCFELFNAATGTAFGGVFRVTIQGCWQAQQDSSSPWKYFRSRLNYREGSSFKPTRLFVESPEHGLDIANALATHPVRWRQR